MNEAWPRGQGAESSRSSVWRRPHPVLPLIRQLWRDVAFVHWPVERQLVQRLLPRGLEIECHREMAWVSMTCFSTTCTIGGLVPLPGARRYPETNVRTYVKAEDGRTGLRFLSLDVTNRANTLLGRALGLPYHLAEMSVTRSGDRVRYTGTRRTRDVAAYDVVIEPAAQATNDPLDAFLAARWSAYVSLRSRLLRVDVAHQPWPLQAATVVTVRESMLAADGIPSTAASPVAHYAVGVDANLAPARLHW